MNTHTRILFLLLGLVAPGHLAPVLAQVSAAPEPATEQPATEQPATEQVAELQTEAASGVAQDEAQKPSFDEASSSAAERLRASLAELDSIRDQRAAEQLPLSRSLREMEGQLSQARAEYQEATRELNRRTLDLANEGVEIARLEDESTYLSGLLGEYLRNFETRLHIAELHRYEEQLDTTKLAMENSGLTQAEIFEKQTALVALSLERLHEAVGGAKFSGTAVDTDGLVKDGTFVLFGPSALFLSRDGLAVGMAEQRLGSLEPTLVRFGDPMDAAAATELVVVSKGRFPLDPTLGNAHKIEAIEETFLEHVQKGGAVMIPIGLMAGAALLVALGKWLGLTFTRKPSRKRVAALLEAVGRGDEASAVEQAKQLKGPIGRMLAVGVEHMREPRELVEEVMYETVLTAKLKLQRFLPFVAICAASAPLLGLLGTVTGIINTFKLITLFGSGDVKTLSGGISEALITTKFGLIVAIPSLLLHAFLSRKARGIVGRMETSAVAFANAVSRSQLPVNAMPAERSRVDAHDSERAERVEGLAGEAAGDESDRVGQDLEEVAVS